MGPESSPTGAPEQVPKPDLIIDFIRHGRTEYGEALKEKIKETGQNPDTFKQMPKLAEGPIADETEQLEGRITEEGVTELRESAKKLAEMIDRQNEIVAIITGTRTRHFQSAGIIEEELKKQSIDVVKTKEHGDLVDVKGGGWYTFVDYILKHQGKSDVDLEQFWWEMYQSKDTREDMNEKGYEHLEDIAKRTEKVAELLRRFVRRFRLGKTLRVIAVVSDINVEQIQQKGIPFAKRDQIWVKNADVVEIKVWNNKNDGSLLKEEMSKPFE
mgnify:CR=1 FL=1